MMRPAPGGTRLLVATGAAAASLDELLPLVRAVVASASDVLVMTPVLTNALQWISSGEA